MRILVTGSAGFIGKNLTLQLLENGHEVVGIDNLNKNYSIDLKKESHSKLISFDEYTFHQCDILDIEKIVNKLSFKNFDLFIHLAANTNVRDSIRNPSHYVKNNVLGTQRALDLAKKMSCRKFIFASSSAVYGEDCDLPSNEKCNTLNPISPYGSSKKAGEDLCFSQHYLHGLDIICFRFFTVYGRWQRPDLAIHKFSKQLLNGKKITMYGDGSSSRDYTHVGDIVDGVIKGIYFLSQNDNVFEKINLGSTQRVKLKELINLLGKKLEIEPKIKQLEVPEGDVDHTWADTSKAKKLLNYSPEVDIKNGLEYFCNWVKDFY